MCAHPIRSLALAVAVAVCTLVLAPVSAWADYETDAVDIQATVMQDGSLNVIESRSFTFDDDVNGMYWTLPLVDNQQGVPTSVQDISVRVEQDGSALDFKQTDAAENGDRGVYTIEQESVGDDAKLKVYNPRGDGDEATITVSYSLFGAVMSWSDTAELYWKFVGPGWDENSYNVTARISFAGVADSGVPAQVGKTLRAWGHGPLEGEVAIDDDATSPAVTYKMPAVATGEFAEARIAFPCAWVPGLAASDSARMDTILDEEQQWAEEANAQREQARITSLVVSVLIVVAAAAVLAVAVGLRLTKYRRHKTVFTDTYFRDVPSDDHPAVIAAFMAEGSVGDEAFVSTLMKLTDEHVIGIDEEKEEKRGLLGKKKPKYRLALLQPEARDGAGIDAAALRMFFRGDTATASIESMKSYASSNADQYTELNDDFKATVRAGLETRRLLLGKGVKVTLIVVAVILIVLFIIAGAALETWAATGVGVLLALAAIVAAATFESDTAEGAELRARCRALKRWLEDFTRLDEAVPGDVVLWNKLLVMGVALGVSDEILRDLSKLTPVPVDTDAYAYYPMYWWFYPHYGHRNSPMSGATSAYAASVAALASSSAASGVGTGGGFSVGGGGGIGGGGGGSF